MLEGNVIKYNFSHTWHTFSNRFMKIEEEIKYFLKIGSPSIRWRVTQPDANVTFLDPKNILLNE